jgi:hypothetical protein
MVGVNLLTSGLAIPIVAVATRNAVRIAGQATRRAPTFLGGRARQCARQGRRRAKRNMEVPTQINGKSNRRRTVMNKMLVAVFDREEAAFAESAARGWKNLQSVAHTSSVPGLTSAT